MPRRYVFLAGRATVSTLGGSDRMELWLGVESEGSIDIAAFSIEHGYDLIPADDFTEVELQSIGVRTFAPFSYDRTFESQYHVIP